MLSSCWEIYKSEFRLYLQNLSRICKMGITFAYELGLKSFIYEKSWTRKLHKNLIGGNPVKHFKNPQKPNRKKDTGLSRSGGKKIQKISNLLVVHRLLGAPLVTEKNIGFEFFWIFFQKMIRNMTGKFEIFFKISSYSWIWTKS